MRNKIIITSLAILILGISFVYAFGVAYDPTPMTMAAGETKVIYLNLQNMVGSDDVTAKIEITKGSEIASLEKDIYEVKIGTYDTDVPIKITIPREEELKNNYTIIVEVRTVTPGTTGGVSLGIGAGAAFYIDIVGEIEQPEWMDSGVIIGLIIAIILVLAIIIVFLKRKKSRLKREKLKKSKKQ